ncbi:MAG: TIGR03905 family TSCPD domain-containing protein [Acidaminococcales bacterium]|nr:TIGR03905 family TSCPD domain-containing protein [Acidaminococcales bacterium]
MPTYKLNNVCPSQVDFVIEGNLLKKVFFYGGCPGNLKAIAALVEGMPADEVIAKLEGIRCGAKETSCADQLAKALKTELGK